jgi:hypothetical protein
MLCLELRPGALQLFRGGIQRGHLFAASNSRAASSTAFAKRSRWSMPEA